MVDIFESEEDGRIAINGVTIYGCKDDEICKSCGKKRYYSLEYDTYYCPFCDIWLEEACDDPECRFCASRPNKPSQLWEKSNQ